MRLLPLALALALLAPGLASAAPQCEAEGGASDLGAAQVGGETERCSASEGEGGPTYASSTETSRVYVADERFTGWEVGLSRSATDSRRTGNSFERACHDEAYALTLRTRATSTEAFDRSSACEGHDAYGPESVGSRSRGVHTQVGLFETEARVDRSRWVHQVPGSERDHQDASLTVAFLSLRGGSVRANGFPVFCAVNGFPAPPPMCDALYGGLAPLAPLP